MAITITRTEPLPAPTGATATTGTATGDLTPGKTYYYRIAARTTTGSVGRVGVPCAEISATADSNGSIDLSWDAVSGAACYLIWRIPISGDYSLNYNDGNDLDHDSDMMLLNNGKTAATLYTTTSTSLTDLGTATERSSSHSYYRWFHNYPLYENGRGKITLDGGDTDIANFEDIYNDAVANGYTDFFKKHYDQGGYKIYECIDDLEIDCNFEDWNFKLIYHNNVRFTDDDTYSRIIGKRVYWSKIASYVISGYSEFVAYNPVGRKKVNSFNGYSCTFYGTRFYRDYGIADKQSYVSWSSVYNTGGGTLSLKNAVLKECLIASYWQQINVNENVDMDNVIIEKNHRGLAIQGSQENSSYNNVFLNDWQYDTTGNYETTLIGCTFYNGATTGIHRFYDVINLNRTLLDCIFPNGHGLPTSASQAYNAYGNTLTLKWSLNIKVLDEYKKPLPNAKVKIIDAKGNKTEVSTDANGDITTQQLTEAVYSRSTDDDGNFDTTDSYTPYKLIIEKSGYKTYKTKFDLTETTNLIISLKPNRFREIKSK